MARHTVDLVVRRHHGADSSASNGFLERREEILAQLALRDLRRRDIDAAFGLAVTGQVLQRREHLAGREPLAVTLQAAHGSDAQLTYEVRILAKGLLDPAPTRITCHVDDRRQHEMHASCANFASDHCADVMDEHGIETARHRDRLRKHCRVRRHVTVQRLFVKQHRDAEPGLSGREALDGIDELDRLGRGAPAVAGAAAGAKAGGRSAAPIGRSRDLSEAMGIRGFCLFLVEDEPVHDVALGCPQRNDLPDLFLQRHPAKEVIDPLCDRRVRIPVGRCAFARSRLRRAAQRNGAGSEQHAARSMRSCPWRRTARARIHRLSPRSSASST